MIVIIMSFSVDCALCTVTGSVSPIFLTATLRQRDELAALLEGQCSPGGDMTLHGGAVLTLLLDVYAAPEDQDAQRPGPPFAMTMTPVCQVPFQVLCAVSSVTFH